MGKLILLSLFLIAVLIFPVYENSKIYMPANKYIKNKIAIANMKKGFFEIYEINLTKKGKFDNLDIFKKSYIAKNLIIEDILKKERYFAKKAILKNKILKAYVFKYDSPNYSFNSDFVVYNLKTKNIKGKKFFLYSDEYNATGRNFFVDKKRNIKANNISFNLKVKE